MRFSYKKGFTLLELLVVIAIIGILASVVLVGISNSKTKAQVSNIKTYFSSIKTQADIFYSTYGNYGASVYSSNHVNGISSVYIPTDPSCINYDNTAGTLFNLGTVDSVGGLLANICAAGATKVMTGTNSMSTPTSWAVKATGPGTNYYCVDNTGVFYYRTSSEYTISNGICT